jgi:hypothetical protein
MSKHEMQIYICYILKWEKGDRGVFPCSFQNFSFGTLIPYKNFTVFPCSNYKINLVVLVPLKPLGDPLIKTPSNTTIYKYKISI